MTLKNKNSWCVVAYGRWRQKDHEFEVSLDCTATPFLKKKKKKKT
jgi:hypothetical protein